MDVDEDGSKAVKVILKSEKLAVGITATAGDALVDAITAVVSFVQTSTFGGAGREELTSQSSDIWYVLSDAVIWPLLRRLGAEIVALEDGVGQNELQDGEIWEAAWALAPIGREAVLNFSEERGYLLPEPSVDSVVADGLWRHALLLEVCSDLMAARIGAGRGFKNLPALANPPQSGNAEEVDDVVGAGSNDQRMSLAAKLIGEVAEATSSASSDSLSGRLANIATSVKATARPAIADGHEGPVLVGGWSLMQEMHIREVAITFHREYSVRRQILLRRLDVTLESMCSGSLVLGDAEGQRKVANALAKMWATWRCGAAEAPRLSEWNALLVTRSKLARAVSARIVEAGQGVPSKLKTMRIGSVPSRGGIPEGYKKSATAGKDAAASTKEKAPAGADTGGQKPKRRAAVTETAGPTTGTSSSSSSSSGAAAPAGSSVTASDMDGAAPATNYVASKPREKGDSKGGGQGARSTNKELLQEYRRELKNPKEAPNYYKELVGIRGGGDESR